jgi:multidrug efflux pump subunit AcrA (membrane-fusion protein)
LGVLSACGHNGDKKESKKPLVFEGVMEGIVIKPSMVPLYYEAVGTIRAKTKAALSSKIAGQIKQVNVIEGSDVNAGDLLLVIDDREAVEKLEQAKAAKASAEKALEGIQAAINQAEAQEKQAEANYSLAQTSYSRYEDLSSQKIISSQEFDSIKAEMQVAEAQLNAANEGVYGLRSQKEGLTISLESARSGVKEAQVLKSHAKVTAPFAGTIVKKYVDAGGFAVSGAPLLEIENPEGFRLEVDVRETEFTNQVELGREVPVQIDALGESLLIGTVVEAAPSADPLSRTFRVKVALPWNPGIKSGMYGKALCPREERQTILIPQKALIKRGQLEQVFSVDESQAAHLRLIKTGKAFGDQLEILAGLQEGEVIIVNPKPGLKDGSRVTVEIK